MRAGIEEWRGPHGSNSAHPTKEERRLFSAFAAHRTGRVQAQTALVSET